jgi:hypothetical protein
MASSRDALFLELISAYENKVSELDQAYYLQDQAAIDRHERNIVRLTEELGIVWRDGSAQWRETDGQ